MDEAHRAYYDRRANEYDDWWLGRGRFEPREHEGWDEEAAELIAVLAGLEPARTLDVGCGTGYLTQHLRGPVVVGLDQSAGMVAIAQERMPWAVAVVGDALSLPFADGAFERVVTEHFYGHLDVGARERFVAEARRVAPELVVVDAALREGVEPEEWQDRVLNDGSVHRIYKRYFTPDGLADELGGGEVLHAGKWFVVVRTRR